MLRFQTLQQMFQRNRRPGDIVFAWFALIVALFLLSQLWDQTAWRNGQKLIAQPRFWPAVSLGGMVFFAALHLIGSMVSERIEGRWREVFTWIRAVEFALWFIAYAVIVPYIGYLLGTVGFVVLLSLRMGYRSRFILIAATLCAVLIVVVFKSLLHVSLPGGQIYEVLPGGLRQFMLTYF
ncbi:tripartite tricarboxylate transporter TctB family protein [Yoonia vestfoldensis]|uniref:Tripartite tricarboxylate transporter TctB family protein n=1 Tax=Yoonia vestfoldensis TaxID=245188 RepID=A0A1Y0E826_9RHOB|nr:tripartite tricarboxylate transporter TctB family protein [Yoonia vestfoldensis]ART99766.1 tripartite tricarboxylate transporter TctB family protein [Yoonia vestfoldensis]